MKTVQQKKYQYIQLISFEELDNWSPYFLLGKAVGYTQNYTLCKIGTFLKRDKTTVKIKNGVFYKRPTIKMNRNGIKLRDEIEGSRIGTKNQFLIKAGQFLLSKIDARNGAFGVVPQELDGGIITGNFWTFDVDYQKINPHYLSLLTGTPAFQRLSQSASVGTTNRHYLQEGIFLNFQIPLPSLEEQDRLVGAYNTKLVAAQEKEKEGKDNRQRLLELLCEKTGVQIKARKAKGSSRIQIVQYKDLARWSLDFLLRGATFSFTETGFTVTKVGKVISNISGGKTPSTSRPDFWDGAINWTSPKDFGNIQLGESSDKITEKALNEAGLQLFPAATILAVFRSGILRHSFPVAITTLPTAINQDLKAITVDKTQVLPKYFLFYLHSFQSLVIEQASKKSVTVESINVDEFLNLPFVHPPLQIQESIVQAIEEQMDEDKKKIEEALQLRTEAIAIFEKAIFQTI